MSFYTCFDWFKKLRLLVNKRRSQGVACRCHRMIFFKWGTFGVIYIYFRLFALFWKNKYIFQYHSKKSLNYAGYTVCTSSTTWLRLFLHEPNKNCDQSFNIYYNSHIRHLSRTKFWRFLRHNQKPQIDEG
jgi:hypothetical protein